MNRLKIRSRILLAFWGVATILIYATLHEFGHVIPAKIFGANIIELDLNIFSPHYRIDSSHLSSLQKSIVAIGGTLFPLIIALMVLKCSSKNNLFSFFSLLFFNTCVSTLIPWIIPIGNGDTIHFISASEISQIYVSLISGLLFTICVIYLLRNRRKVFEPFKLFYKGHFVINTKAYFRQLIGLIGFIVIFFIINPPSISNAYPSIGQITIYSKKFDRNTILPFEFPVFYSSGNDALMVQARKLTAEYIKAGYILSTNNDEEEIMIFKGGGINLLENRSYGIIPKKGKIYFIIDGKNIKGEITIKKKKQPTDNKRLERKSNNMPQSEIFDEKKNIAPISMLGSKNYSDSS